MGYPIYATASTDKAVPNATKIFTITLTPAASQAWSVAIYDSLGHATGQILQLSGTTGTTPSPLPYAYEGLECRTGLSFVLSGVTAITFEVG